MWYMRCRDVYGPFTKGKSRWFEFIQLIVFYLRVISYKKHQRIPSDGMKIDATRASVTQTRRNLKNQIVTDVVDSTFFFFYSKCCESVHWAHVIDIRINKCFDTLCHTEMNWIWTRVKYVNRTRSSEEFFSHFHLIAYTRKWYNFRHTSLASITTPLISGNIPRRILIALVGEL